MLNDETSPLNKNRVISFKLATETHKNNHFIGYSCPGVISHSAALYVHSVIQSNLIIAIFLQPDHLEGWFWYTNYQLDQMLTSNMSNIGQILIKLTW